MINFFNQVSESLQECPENTLPWITAVIQEENFVEGDINYIFMNDEMLLELNKKFLDHDTYTDIITFDLSEKENVVSGEIYISTDRVIENAAKYNVIYPEEMHRVLIHGILHLCGYNDKSEEEKEEMRAKENYYLGKIDLNLMLES